MSLLDAGEINKFVENYGWSRKEDSITREFTLADFSAALAFVVRIGIEAEKADHHPDIQLFSWNKVKIVLSTHSEGGITQKDISLAKVIEKL